jgi:hypothetical protein
LSSIDPADAFLKHHFSFLRYAASPLDWTFFQCDCYHDCGATIES